MFSTDSYYSLKNLKGKKIKELHFFLHRSLVKTLEKHETTCHPFDKRLLSSTNITIPVSSLHSVKRHYKDHKHLEELLFKHHCLHYLDNDYPLNKTFNTSYKASKYPQPKFSIEIHQSHHDIIYKKIINHDIQHHLVQLNKSFSSFSELIPLFNAVEYSPFIDSYLKRYTDLPNDEKLTKQPLLIMDLIPYILNVKTALLASRSEQKNSGEFNKRYNSSFSKFTENRLNNLDNFLKDLKSYSRLLPLQPDNVDYYDLSRNNEDLSGFVKDKKPYEGFQKAFDIEKTVTSGLKQKNQKLRNDFLNLSDLEVLKKKRNKKNSSLNYYKKELSFNDFLIKEKKTKVEQTELKKDIFKDSLNNKTIQTDKNKIPKSGNKKEIKFPDFYETLYRAEPKKDEFDDPYELDEENIPALERFGTDLTDMASKGWLEKSFGREKELTELMEILARRQKNNPVLVGEAGVGKTAVVELFAYSLANNLVPFVLEGRRVINMDLGRMLAGSRYRGEFEARFQSMLEEIENQPDIIIFIDEIHTLSGTGSAEGSLDAANMLKPALSRPGFQCIGATTNSEYQRIEKDPALNRRFQRILVAEPTKEDTLAILYNLRPALESFHNVRFPATSLRAAVELSDRYITDRNFPDKAIDLLDRAGAKKVVKLTSKDEGTIVRSFVNNALKNLGKLKEEAYRKGDIASEFILTEIQNVYSRELLQWLEDPISIPKEIIDESQKFSEFYLSQKNFKKKKKTSKNRKNIFSAPVYPYIRKIKQKKLQTKKLLFQNAKLYFLETKSNNNKFSYFQIDEAKTFFLTHSEINLFDDPFTKGLKRKNYSLKTKKSPKNLSLRLVKNHLYLQLLQKNIQNKNKVSLKNQKQLIVQNLLMNWEEAETNLQFLEKSYKVIKKSNFFNLFLDLTRKEAKSILFEPLFSLAGETLTKLNGFSTQNVKLLPPFGLFNPSLTLINFREEEKPENASGFIDLLYSFFEKKTYTLFSLFGSSKKALASQFSEFLNEFEEGAGYYPKIEFEANLFKKIRQSEAKKIEYFEDLTHLANLYFSSLYIIEEKKPIKDIFAKFLNSSVIVAKKPEKINYFFISSFVSYFSVFMRSVFLQKIGEYEYLKKPENVFISLKYFSISSLTNEKSKTFLKSFPSLFSEETLVKKQNFRNKCEKSYKKKQMKKWKTKNFLHFHVIQKYLHKKRTDFFQKPVDFNFAKSIHFLHPNPTKARFSKVIILTKFSKNFHAIPLLRKSLQKTSLAALFNHWKFVPFIFNRKEKYLKKRKLFSKILYYTFLPKFKNDRKDLFFEKQKMVLSYQKEKKFWNQQKPWKLSLLLRKELPLTSVQRFAGNFFSSNISNHYVFSSTTEPQVTFFKTSTNLFQLRNSIETLEKFGIFKFGKKFSDYNVQLLREGYELPELIVAPQKIFELFSFFATQPEDKYSKFRSVPLEVVFNYNFLEFSSIKKTNQLNEITNFWEDLKLDFSKYSHLLKLDALGKKSRIDREQKGFKSGDWRRISSKFFPIIFSNYYPYIKYFRGKKFKFKPKKFAFVKINLEENVKKSLFETLYRAFLRKEMGGEWHYRLFVGRLLAQKLSKTANTTLLTSELAKDIPISLRKKIARTVVKHTTQLLFASSSQYAPIKVPEIRIPFGIDTEVISDYLLSKTNKKSMSEIWSTWRIAALVFTKYTDLHFQYKKPASYEKKYTRLWLQKAFLETYLTLIKNSLVNWSKVSDILNLNDSLEKSLPKLQSFFDLDMGKNYQEQASKQIYEKYISGVSEEILVQLNTLEDFLISLKPLIAESVFASLRPSLADFSISDEELQILEGFLGFYSSPRGQLVRTYLQSVATKDNSSESLNYQLQTVVTQEDINELVGAMTGIPLTSLSAADSKKLLNLEKYLQKRVIGQEAAITAMGRALRRSRLGIQNPNRPIGSFLFCGPTGVGKTEVTKALTEHIFGNENEMIRFDMSEFMEKFSVSRLVGAPPGYVGYEEGGQLTDRVRRKPYSVVLFDEIEKAHPDVVNLLLQILEDGRLTDSQKRLVHFDNTILILTSNAAAYEILEIISQYQEEKTSEKKEILSEEQSDTPKYEALNAFLDAPIKENFLKDLHDRIIGSMGGFPENVRNTSYNIQNLQAEAKEKAKEEKEEKEKQEKKKRNLRDSVLEKLGETFLPEFLNRLDEIIVFEPLKVEELRRICDILIDNVVDRVSKKNIFVQVENPVRLKLSQDGFDPLFGARPLRRLVTKYVEDLVTETVLNSSMRQGNYYVRIYLNRKEEICADLVTSFSQKTD